MRSLTTIYRNVSRQPEGGPLPNRSYVPRFSPPSRFDHALAHPGTTAIASWWIVTGALVLFGAFTGRVSSSPSVQALPELLSILLGVTVGLGGALSLWGTMTKHEAVSRAWTAQIVGYVLAGSGWSAYAVAVIASSPEAVLSWGQGVAYAAMCLIGIIATSRTERAKREEMRQNGLEA